jgi:hypothetical protein
MSIYRIIERLLGFGGPLLTLRPLELVAVLGLSVVFREANHTNILPFRYHSIDIHFIFLHVKFEDGLSISGLKNKATRRKNCKLEIESF